MWNADMIAGWPAGRRPTLRGTHVGRETGRHPFPEGGNRLNPDRRALNAGSIAISARRTDSSGCHSLPIHRFRMGSTRTEDTLMQRFSRIEDTLMQLFNSTNALFRGRGSERTRRLNQPSRRRTAAG